MFQYYLHRVKHSVILRCVIDMFLYYLHRAVYSVIVYNLLVCSSTVYTGLNTVSLQAVYV